MIWLNVDWTPLTLHFSECYNIQMSFCETITKLIWLYSRNYPNDILELDTILPGNIYACYLLIEGGDGSTTTGKAWTKIQEMAATLAW